MVDKSQLRTLYLLPAPDVQGGMTAITKMYYDAGLFDPSNTRHFNTSFKSSIILLRAAEGVIMKLNYLLVLFRFRPHVVHAMTSSYWGFYDKCVYCIIARVCGIKSILNPVGGGFSDFYEGSLFHKRWVNIAIKFPNAIVVGSSYWESYFKEKFKDIRIQNIPNPVNSSVYLRGNRKYKEQNRVKIISVSNIIETKGIRELCIVIRELIKKVDTVDFDLLGDGALRPWLESELADEITNGRVRILGFVSDDVKKDCLLQSDIFVMLSYFEIIPISILEAMSASLPLISTNVGGVPDLVEEGVNGYLVLPTQTTEVVDRLIEMCSLSSEEMAALGESSYLKILEKYDVYSVIQEHENLSFELLQSS
jgi:glycosyltransferase involved in cell wall biosynthesis